MHRPPFHIWENVKEVLDNVGNEKAIDTVKQLFAMIGYVFAFAIFQATSHGLPQKRQRIVGVTIHIVKSGLSVDACQDLATAIVAKAQKMATECRPLSSCMLPAAAPELADYLVAKIANKGTEKENAEWGKAAVEYCIEKNICLSSLHAPASTKLSPWWDILPSREKQIVIIYYTVHGEKLRSIDLLNTVRWMQPVVEGGHKMISIYLLL
jgi:site-specific DNA-cytosine methylase